MLFKNRFCRLFARRKGRWERRRKKRKRRRKRRRRRRREVGKKEVRREMSWDEREVGGREGGKEVVEDGIK